MSLTAKRQSLVMVPLLALLLIFAFSFGALAAESPIELVEQKSGEAIPCYDEPVTAEDGTVTHHIYLQLPEEFSNKEISVFLHKSGGAATSGWLRSGTFDAQGAWTQSTSVMMAANKSQTIDTSLLKTEYNVGDTRYLVVPLTADIKGNYYLYVATPVPTVKSINTSTVHNHAGNNLNCTVGAVFSHVADDTAVNVYITDKQDGTSADALEGTLVKTTAAEMKSSCYEAGAVSVPTKDLAAGQYYVAVETGESRAYQPFTIYATAREYAEAAQKLFVKWYQTKGFVSSGEYVGLSQDSGNGTGIDWEAYIFGAMGYSADDRLLTTPPNKGNKTYLDLKATNFSRMTEEQLVQNQGSAPAAKILGRQILGIAGLGGDPRDIGGKDLVKALISLAYKDHDIEGGELNLDEDGSLHVRVADNDTICEGYFLLALEVCNATPEEGYTEEIRAAGLKTLKNACGSVVVEEGSDGEDGDFTSTGHHALSDYYSMSLYPLCFLNDVKGMEGEAQKILDQFKKNYQTVIKNGSKMNVFSIAVAHSALAAGGLTFEEYATDPAWTDANGQSEISRLLADQNVGGGIGGYDTRMAIYEVLQGLTDILNGKTCFEIAHETYMKNYPQYSDGYAGAKAVEEQLNALPKDATLKDKADVQAARKAYDALSDDAKAQVGEDAVKKLTAAEEKVMELGVAAMTDVKAKDWFYNDVAFCLYNDLFKGMTETTFGPNTSMTRAHFVTVLGRYAGIEDSSKSNPADKTQFSDVKSSAYYASHVKWAVENNITKGVTEKEFAPDEPVTREQMAAFMQRFAEVMKIDLPEADKTKFADDGKIRSYAKDAVYSMKAANILRGNPDNTFNPQGESKRSEVAAVLHRFLTLK